jgi:aminoglycoside phosphotransferase (APT) family kinase protein
LEARWDDGATEKLVLRRDTVEPPIYPAQSPGTTTGVATQHAVMDVLRRAGLPVAESLGVEEDPEVLGVAFFVMRHVAGDVPGEDPPYTRAGFYAEARPEERRQLVQGGLQTLARVHEIPVDDPGLAVLRPPGVVQGAGRQLEVWETSLRSGLDGRTTPLFDDSLVWLHANEPPPVPLVLSWGDSRPGNIIWGEFHPLCLTDFEGAAIGPRELDLGWWLMCDRWLHERSGVPRLEGEPDRDEQRDLYLDASAADLGPTGWYEVFSALRFATTVVHVMNRWVARGAMPADQTIWRDNPATAVLADLFEEATA